MTVNQERKRVLYVCMALSQIFDMKSSHSMNFYNKNID